MDFRNEVGFFASSKLKQSHLKNSHLENQNHECNISTKGLKKHVEIVHEERKKYICGSCSFSISGNLKVHILNFHDVTRKTENCDHCDESFTNLKKHTTEVQEQKIT